MIISITLINALNSVYPFALQKNRYQEQEKLLMNVYLVRSI